MNFEEALEFKRKLGQDRITKSDLTMKVTVTPANFKDFKRYLTDYLGSNFSDETAKRYCSNGQFKVHGIWTDGANVIHDDLTNS